RHFRDPSDADRPRVFRRNRVMPKTQFPSPSFTSSAGGSNEGAGPAPSFSSSSAGGSNEGASPAPSFSSSRFSGRRPENHAGGVPGSDATGQPAAAQVEPDAEPARFDRSMPQPAAIAHAILEGFDLHYRRFRYVAQQAKARFEAGDWHGMRASARERIDFYDRRVLDAVTRIQLDFDLDCLSDQERDGLWQAVRQQYVAALARHRQPECAETFFNTVCTQLL